MKKKKILIISVALLLLSLFATLVGCNNTTDSDEVVEQVKTYYQETKNATEITQTISVTSGDFELSSKVTEYRIGSDKNVNVTETVKTLNDDISSPDLYNVVVSDFILTAEQSESVLPTATRLDPEDFANNSFTYTTTEGISTLSFAVKNNAVATYFNLSAVDAAKINNLNVVITVSNKKVVEYQATYLTDNGNTTSIVINFEYAA